MLKVYQTSIKLENAVINIEALQKELAVYEVMEKSILNRFKEVNSIKSMNTEELRILVYIERLRYELAKNNLDKTYEEYRLNKDNNPENAYELFTYTMNNKLGYLKAEELYQYYLDIQSKSENKSFMKDFIHSIDYYLNYIYANKKLPISEEELAKFKKYHSYFQCRYEFEYTANYSLETSFKDDLKNEAFKTNHNPELSYIDNINEFDAEACKALLYSCIKNRLKTY